jgi:hypothetical protein
LSDSAIEAIPGNFHLHIGSGSSAASASTRRRNLGSRGFGLRFGIDIE